MTELDPELLAALLAIYDEEHLSEHFVDIFYSDPKCRRALDWHRAKIAEARAAAMQQCEDTVGHNTAAADKIRHLKGQKP